MNTEDAGWGARLRAGLGKTSARLSDGITAALSTARIDAAALDNLEDALIGADLGAAAAARLRAALEKKVFAEVPAPAEAAQVLADEIAAVLAPVAQDLKIDAAKKPFVVLVCGVNGTGKTTTIGKLAARAKSSGHTVMLAAGDTFRAAAIEQLEIWGERAGAEVITADAGSDAAALAFRAHETARAQGADVLFVDTAGRLQNKTGLMDELKKTVRVLGKQDASAPHAVLLVLDGTTGQNALSQVETFKEAVNVTGLIVTKLDGTAKGGVVIALADKFGLPVHAVGVGEGADDLRPFDARGFAESLLGIEQGR